MKTIRLFSGEEVLVDDQDFDLVNAHSWYASNSRRDHIYATTTIKGQWVSMHRMILGTPKGLVVDHKDRNGLNNQRSNLRECTNGQNRANSITRRALPKGVYPRIQRTGGLVFRAQIRHGKHLTNLGTFKTIDEAATAYASAAKQIHKEFAKP